MGIAGANANINSFDAIGIEHIHIAAARIDHGIGDKIQLLHCLMQMLDHRHLGIKFISFKTNLK